MATRSLSLVLHAPHDLRLEPRDVPEPAVDEAIVDIAFGGICGSDLHYYADGSAGNFRMRDPFVLGHEIVGVVAQAAADGSGPAAGTPVALHPSTTCGHCAQCVRGDDHLCDSTRFLGSAAKHPHTDGGYTTRRLVRSAQLRALPSGMPLEAFAMTEPGSVAWHAAGRGPAVAGIHALVIGAGPIGLAMVQVLRAQQAGAVSVSDLHARPVEIARGLGAQGFVGGEVQAHAGAFDVVYECSGSARGLASAIDLVRPGGEVVMVGNQQIGEISFPAAQAISKEVRLAGCFRFNSEFDEVITAIADGILDLTPIVSHIFPAAEHAEAFRVAASSAESSKVLIDFRGIELG